MVVNPSGLWGIAGVVHLSVATCRMMPHCTTSRFCPSALFSKRRLLNYPQWTCSGEDVLTLLARQIGLEVKSVGAGSWALPVGSWACCVWVCACACVSAVASLWQRPWTPVASSLIKLVAFRLLGCVLDCSSPLQVPSPDLLFLVDVVRWFGPRLVSCFAEVSSQRPLRLY